MPRCPDEASIVTPRESAPRVLVHTCAVIPGNMPFWFVLWQTPRHLQWTRPAIHNRVNFRIRTCMCTIHRPHRCAHSLGATIPAILALANDVDLIAWTRAYVCVCVCRGGGVQRYVLRR